MHQDHRASLVLAINQLAQKLNYRLSNNETQGYQTYVSALKQVTIHTHLTAVAELEVHAEYYAKKLLIRNQASHA